MAGFGVLLEGEDMAEQGTSLIASRSWPSRLRCLIHRWGEALHRLTPVFGVGAMLLVFSNVASPAVAAHNRATPY